MGKNLQIWWGKDLYLFYIVRATLTSGLYLILPAGTKEELGYATCQIGDGSGCAAKRIYNTNDMP